MHFHRFIQGMITRDKALAGGAGLFVVLGLAVFLRSAYLDWGIPGAYRIDTVPVLGFHPDEPILINQIRELLEGPRHFSVFTYPPLQAQITAVLAKISGTHSTTGLYLLARWISVVASLLTVWFAWLIGSLWNRSMGLTAAVFMAFTMEACHQAHWANPESLCTLGIVAGTWFCLRGPGTRNLLWAGLCIGLSICAKYFGILFLHLPLIAAYSRGGNARTILRQW
jgi:4-amino-4-deoxy-L-arabinose transferase-like glycosyltransferase